MANTKLSTGEFQFTERQTKTLAEWQEGLSEDVQSFIERGSDADKVFPALKGLRPGQDAHKVRELLTRIASDMEGLREMYDGFRPADFPPAAIVGRTWAVFRWVQVHLVGAIEFFAKYGAGVNAPNPERLENERTDLNYLVTAVLAGGLATRDEAMARRFKALCPTGMLIS